MHSSDMMQWVKGKLDSPVSGLKFNTVNIIKFTYFDWQYNWFRKDTVYWASAAVSVLFWNFSNIFLSHLPSFSYTFEVMFMSCLSYCNYEILTCKWFSGQPPTRKRQIFQRVSICSWLGARKFRKYGGQSLSRWFKSKCDRYVVMLLVRSSFNSHLTNKL